MSEIVSLLDQCLLHAEHVRNLSKNYVASVRITYKMFLRDTRIRFAEECDRDSLESWLLNGRVNYGWKPATYRAHHRNLGFLFRWMRRRGLIHADPTVGMELPKLGHHLPKALSKEDAETLFYRVKKFKYAYRFEGKRNAAIVALMLFTWLRKQEVANLKTEDVDLSRMLVTVVQGKGGKDRIVPISTSLSGVLREYQKDRERLDKKSESFFTAVQKDVPMGTQCVDNLIARLRVATGLKFSAHSLRHTFATLMLEGGCDLYTLSRMMGHSKIATTTIYLACSPRMMTASIERHPLN